MTIYAETATTAEDNPVTVSVLGNDPEAAVRGLIVPSVVGVVMAAIVTAQLGTTLLFFLRRRVRVEIANPGRRLLPGMVDDQVHFREPGMEYKADMAIESGAAVAGGLTSFMDMPNTSPPTLDAEALENKYQRAAGRVRGNYGFYMGTSTSNLEHIQRLDPLTAPGVKVFMGASTGNMLVDDPATLEGIFRDAPTVVITHCEDSPTIAANEAALRAELGEQIPVDDQFQGYHLNQNWVGLKPGTEYQWRVKFTDGAFDGRFKPRAQLRAGQGESIGRDAPRGSAGRD